MRRSAVELAKACASVLATTNSTPLRPHSIMLLTALPPAPPTPNTVMRGLSSVKSGTLRLIDMVAFRSVIVLCPGPSSALPRDAPSSALLIRLEIVPYPIADPGEITGAGTQETLFRARAQPVVATRPLQEEADRR